MTLRKNLISNHGDPFSLLLTYREWLQGKACYCRILASIDSRLSIPWLTIHPGVKTVLIPRSCGSSPKNLKVKSEGRESSKTWCRKRGIEEQRLYEITKLRRQFKDLLEEADLIEKKSLHDTRAVGSSDRRIRAGELKQLKELKRKYQHEKRKRKVLKADEHFDTIASKAEEDIGSGDPQTMAEKEERKGGDVNALEFQMKYTGRELEGALREHKLNHEIATILKLVLCSALYPQYGVLDQYNHYKLGTDQVVHTKSKPFLILHPNSSMAQEPECLEHTGDKDGGSENHQAIFYGLLLETTKPYIVNSLRVPALHSLLLFSRQVDTSGDFSRIVFDEFVEVLISGEGGAEELVSAATDLRKLMFRCLERKLEGDTYRSDRLGKKLLDFVSRQVNYSLKKISQSDRQSFFSPTLEEKQYSDKEKQLISAQSKTDKDKQDVDQPIIDRQGRSLIGQFLSVGSLPAAGESVGTSSQYLSVRWTCPKCQEDFYSNSVEKLTHIASCKDEQASGLSVQDPGDEPEPMEGEDADMNINSNPLLKSYFCPDCKKQLSLTPVDFLKHKRKHLSS